MLDSSSASQDCFRISPLRYPFFFLRAIVCIVALLFRPHHGTGLVLYAIVVERHVSTHTIGISTLDVAVGKVENEPEGLIEVCQDCGEVIMLGS